MASVGDRSALSPFILNMNEACLEHKEKFTYFCRDHDKLICKKCKPKHRKCKDVPSIDQITQNVKSSVLFENTFSNLDSQCRNLSKLAGDREKNLKHLKSLQTTMTKSIEDQIDQLVSQLNKLKTAFLSDLDKIIDDNVKEISESSRVIIQGQNSLHDILKQREDIKQLASNFQVFVGLKEIETAVHESNKHIQEMTENNLFKHVTVSTELDRTITEIIPKMKSIGKVMVAREEQAVNLEATNTNEGQIEVRSTLPNSVKLQKKVEVKYGNPNSCCVLTNGDIVVSYDNFDEEIYLFRSDGSMKESFKCKDASDVAQIDENLIAVAQTESISIIDITKKNKIRKILSTEESVLSVTCQGLDIVFISSYNKIMKVNINSGKADTIFEDDSLDFHSKIAANTQRICYTSPCQDKITVLDSENKVVFIYQDENVCRYPSGISIDEHMNIYVCCRQSNNLLAISADGEICHQLVNEPKELLGSPRALHYNLDTKQLAVLNQVSCLVVVWSIDQ